MSGDVRRVLFFGTYDDQRSPRAGILRQGFTECGWVVDECVVPLGMSSDLRVQILRRPWLLPVFVLRLLVTWIRLLIRSVQFRRPDLVVIGYMAHLDVHLARVRYPTTTIVLDHLVSLSGTHADRSAGGGRFQRFLGSADRAAVRRSDVVAVDTAEHRDEVGDEFRDRTVVVPVGAQRATFDAGAHHHAAAPPPLRVVFYGHYIPLQGTPTIGAALAELHRRGRDDIAVTMVGRGQDLDEARRLAGDAPSVTWVDRIVTRDELTRIVDQHHVALGIFGTTDKAAKVVPTKGYEALAAGLALITGDTEPQRRCFGDAVRYVPVGDAMALADAIEDLADHPDEVTARAAAGRALAETKFSPGAVVAPLLEAVRAGDRL